MSHVFSSTCLGTNSLNNVDVPLSNKQTSYSHPKTVQKCMTASRRQVQYAAFSNGRSLEV